MVIPQNLSGKNPLSVKIEYTVAITGKEPATFSPEITLPGVNMLPGEQCTYTFVISVHDEVVLDGISIRNWYYGTSPPDINI